MIEPVRIGNRVVGLGQPVFIIAEAGVNHNGDEAMARALVDAAVAAGVDAVKFQTFTAEAVISPNAPKAEYQKVTTDAGESQLDMCRSFELPPEAFVRLAAYCTAKNIMFLSTPFDHGSADLLNRLQVPAFKIPSGEITNMPLLRHVAAMGRPVILSTGMSNLGEAEAAIDTLQRHGADGVIVLHCTSAYPAPPESVNLRAVATLQTAFQIPAGYSDHTEGVFISVAAAALGACVIEKHFTLDKDLPGPDHKASLNPAELTSLVTAVRQVERALGNGVKKPVAAELDTKHVARRSLFAARAIAAGSVIDASDVIALRPAGGIPPLDIDRIVGSTTVHDITSGAMLDWDDLR